MTFLLGLVVGFLFGAALATAAAGLLYLRSLDRWRLNR